MMRSRSRKNCIRFPQAPIGLLETREESRHRAGADRNVPTDLHVAVPQLSRHDSQPLARIRIVNPQQLIRQQLAETTVNFSNTVTVTRAPSSPPVIDPALNCDMRLRLEL